MCKFVVSAVILFRDGPLENWRGGGEVQLMVRPLWEVSETNVMLKFDLLAIFTVKSC